MDVMRLPVNSTRYGFSVLIGHNSTTPPRIAKRPLPRTVWARSYPKSTRRQISPDGFMTKSDSIKKLLSRHHGFVSRALLIEARFLENHKAPRSRFWGDTLAIKNSL